MNFASESFELKTFESKVMTTVLIEVQENRNGVWAAFLLKIINLKFDKK